ncbi:MAG: T9SS type A sorting domain-containing protein [Chlorobi bacterium]|nr:T9SS type A sorting domain-containing protein [Chlorobiota bacterium]
MRTKLFLAPVFILLFGLVAQSQNNNNQLFKERGEVFFKFNMETPKDIHFLTNTISIDDVQGTLVFAYANEKGFSEFLGMGIDYTILPHPGDIENPNMKSSIDLKNIDSWDFYPTYEAYVDMMYQFQTDYPGLCQVYSIGQSVQNRELLMARISDNVGTDEGEAQFLYTSTMHGDETTGFPLMLRFIDYLLSNYGSDDRVTGLVNNLDIYINPNANPDGTYHGGNNTVNGAQRYNANNVDLNRNYPDPQDGPHPDGEAWQPETLAFMAFAESHHIVLACNMHGGAEVCNYPWDTWAQYPADTDWWQYVMHEYADTAQLFSPNGYMSGFDDGITNGYAWYEVNGGRQDYMNYFQQCREFTIELSDQKLLPPSQLPAHWDYNYRSFLNYLEQVQYGVSGTITDADTGDPLVGEVYIESHEADSSWVYSGVLGDYHRPLYQGTYDITYSAIGYIPQTINVTVANKETSIVDVQLESGDLIADFTASTTNVSIGGSVNFTDLSFGSPVSWEWTFEEGTPSTSNEQNPTGIVYSNVGSFDVSLTVSDGTNSQTITKNDYIHATIDIVMENTTITTCLGTFYDTGGSANNYGDDEDITMIFLPGTEGAMIECVFTMFNVEDESSCNYDWLKIYDGNSTSATLIGKYCGTDSPGTITATNQEGAITFQFHSDGSVTKPGWAANISCAGITFVNEDVMTQIKVFPNPAKDVISISSPLKIQSIVILDMIGKQILVKEVNQESINLNISGLDSGLYFVNLKTEEGIVTKKIRVL